MRHLQQVERGHPSREQLGIHAFFHVARQQEPLVADLAEQDDRDVVDPRAAVGRPLGHPVGIGPEDPQADRIEHQPIACREAPSRWPARREHCRPGVVAGSRPDHPRFVHPPHSIALQQRSEAGDVVLVGVGEHEDVDAPIPGRQALVQRQQQAARIRSAVDDHPAASIPEDQDAVALPDVEHHDVHCAVGPVRERQRERDRRARQCARRHARCTSGPGVVPVA